MRTTIAFLAGAAIGAASAVLALAGTLNALADDAVGTLPDDEGEALDRSPHHDVDGRGGIILTFDPPATPPGFHPSMLAEAWQAGHDGRRL